MFARLRRLLPAPISPELRAKLRGAAKLSSAGFDTYGLHPETLERVLRWTRWLYYSYFRVEVEGLENVPAGRVMLVPNHGGQLPLDGMLVGLAMALEGLSRGVQRRPMRNPAAQNVHMVVNGFMGGMAELMSTHPPIEERVRRLREMELG